MWQFRETSRKTFPIRLIYCGSKSEVAKGLAFSRAVITLASSPRGFLRFFQFVPLRTVQRFPCFFGCFRDSPGFFELLYAFVIRTTRVQASGIFFLFRFAFRCEPMFNFAALRPSLALPNQVSA